MGKHSRPTGNEIVCGVRHPTRPDIRCTKTRGHKPGRHFFRSADTTVSWLPTPRMKRE